MKYTITLANGRQLKDLSLNGTNFISKEKIDESIFENNLSTISVSNGFIELTYKDVVFIRQEKQSDGTYFIALGQKTEREKIFEAITTNGDSVTDLQLALAEVYEYLLKGGI